MVSLKRFVRDLYDLIQVAISIVFLLEARTIHRAYGRTSTPRGRRRAPSAGPGTRGEEHEVAYTPKGMSGYWSFYPEDRV